MNGEPSDTATGEIIGADVGGTFTDVVMWDGVQIATAKVPTSVQQGEAVVAAASELSDGVEAFIHGTTTATNALLQHAGARTLLSTSPGFEDVIEIGRQDRPSLYDPFADRAEVLVQREDRSAGVDGVQLDRYESVAVSLLYSFDDPGPERAIRDRVHEIAPELEVSLSSEVAPEFREFERTSTTVLNAYLQPMVAAYFADFQQRVSDAALAERVSVMRSSGGLISTERAAQLPASILLSGPAAGAVAAASLASALVRDRVVSFDMGGTSTDVSLCPGAPLHTRELEIGGQPVAIPVIDIHTVGAGGGSLARIDPGGALRVGPESAGADPGPICYGKGGAGVTVTDAHVWLGRLPSDAFLGGERTLDRSAVEPHLRNLADGLGTNLEVAAEGILAVADAAMERALRVISVERGHDPADFTLVAFGGAGGLHATHLAERLGTHDAIVPPRPGLLSAYGMLAADVTREVSRTVLISTASAHAHESIESVFTELEQAAVAAMAEEGVPEDRLLLWQWVDARYERQSFELRVPAQDWDTRFHELHETRYGYQRPETPVEAVTLRSVASAPGPPLDLERTPHKRDSPPIEQTQVYLEGQWREVDRVWRDDLSPEQTLAGPALVLEYSATTWVPGGWGLEVDEWGNLHLSAT